MMTASTAIEVRIPGTLRAYCNGASVLLISAPNVRMLLTEMERLYPVLYRNICDEMGSVRRHINLFVNNLHLRDREGIDTALSPGDVLTVLPAVSGG